MTETQRKILDHLKAAGVPCGVYSARTYEPGGFADTFGAPTAAIRALERASKITVRRTGPGRMVVTLTTPTAMS